MKRSDNEYNNTRRININKSTHLESAPLLSNPEKRSELKVQPPMDPLLSNPGERSEPKVKLSAAK